MIKSKQSKNINNDNKDKIKYKVVGTCTDPIVIKLKTNKEKL